MRNSLGALVLVLAVGCGKKAGPAPDEGPPDPGSPRYTIKIPNRLGGGEKWAVTFRHELRVKGEGGRERRTLSMTEEQVYVQTNLADDGSKVERVYQVSRFTDGISPPAAHSYVGKVVAIEKKNGLFTYTTNGEPIADAGNLVDEFQGKGARRINHLLPAAAVREKETWTAIKDALPKPRRAPMNEMTEMAPKVMRFTGQLVRAYPRAGSQCGVIEWEINLNPDGSKSATQQNTGTLRYDGPIDGSKGEAKLTINRSGPWHDGSFTSPTTSFFEDSETWTFTEK